MDHLVGRACDGLVQAGPLGVALVEFAQRGEGTGQIVGSPPLLGFFVEEIVVGRLQTWKLRIPNRQLAEVFVRLGSLAASGQPPGFRQQDLLEQFHLGHRSPRNLVALEGLIDQVEEDLVLRIGTVGDDPVGEVQGANFEHHAAVLFVEGDSVEGLLPIESLFARRSGCRKEDERGEHRSADEAVVATP